MNIRKLVLPQLTVVVYRGHRNLSANLRQSARIGFGLAKIRVNSRTKELTTF